MHVPHVGAGLHFPPNDFYASWPILWRCVLCFELVFCCFFSVWVDLGDLSLSPPRVMSLWGGAGDGCAVFVPPVRWCSWSVATTMQSPSVPCCSVEHAFWEVIQHYWALVRRAQCMSCVSSTGAFSYLDTKAKVFCLLVWHRGWISCRGGNAKFITT